jgi:hypothetical protein
MVQPLRSRLDSKTQREQPMKPLLEIEWNENIRKVIAPLPSTVIIGISLVHTLHTGTPIIYLFVNKVNVCTYLCIHTY